jgi:hypothetical protein
VTNLNEANKLIHELLIRECVFPIDLDNIRIEQWLYQSMYPLAVPEQSNSNRHAFIIQLYQWGSSMRSLKLIELKYQSTPNSRFEYLKNDKIDDSINQLGKNFIQTEEFIHHVKPLLIKGFRDLLIKNLLVEK